MIDIRRFASDLDRFLTRLTPFGFSGAALVAAEQDVLLRRGYGLADRAQDVANTPETAFSLGSVTKQFAAAALMKLAQDAKLHPDDAMSKYLDGVPDDKASITLHHLLTHTAGTVNYTGPDFEPATREQMLDRVFGHPLFFEPGTEYKYSNAGYSVVAAIVEIVAGQPFEQFLYENLLRPAGLEHTGYIRPDWTGRTIARWYTGATDNGHALEKPYPSWNLMGNGQMLSTVDDMLRWHQALLGDELLDAAIKQRMYTPFLHDYAYGWDVRDTPLGKLIGHNGASDLGDSALFRRYLDAGLTIILFFNQAYGTTPMVQPLQAKLDLLLAGQEVELPPEVEPGSGEELVSFEGGIGVPGGERIAAEVAGNTLVLYASGQGAINPLAFPDSPPDAHAALNEEHARVFSAAVEGNFGPLRGFMANAEKRLDPVKRLLQTSLAEAKKEYGTRTGIEVLGTVPSSFRAEALDTIVRVRMERGTTEIVSITDKGVNVGVAVLEMAHAWTLPCVPVASRLIGYHLPLGRVIEIDVTRGELGWTL